MGKQWHLSAMVANGYPKNWKSEIRPRIMTRDNHQCIVCGVHNYAIKYPGGILPHRFSTYKEANSFLGGVFIPNMTLEQFKTRFPSDRDILHMIYKATYEHIPCSRCGKVGKRHMMKAATRFNCQCGQQVSPIARTAMAGTKQPLSNWLYGFYLLHQNPNLMAMDLRRAIGIKWPSCLRMIKLLRQSELKFTELFENPNAPENRLIIFGDIEIDPKRCRIITLSVAHLHNPDPADCRDENLGTMCNACHMRHDAALHTERSRATRLAKKSA